MTTIGREALARDVDLIISQGADNQYVFRYSTDLGGVRTPVDLTGYTARAQIRKKWGGDLWHSMTDGAGIELGGPAGTITVTIDNTVTEDPAWNARSSVRDGEAFPTGVWDLELIHGNDVVRFVMGTVTISPDVTRTAQ